MQVWTSLRVKSNKQSDIITHYNLEFHNKLNNSVQRFYVPCGVLGKKTVSLLPNLLFVLIEGNTLEEIGGLFGVWMGLESNIFYPNIIKDDESDATTVEVIPSSEMESFLKGVSNYFVERDSMDMNLGDTIEVVSGPFRGRRGILAEIRKEHVVVAIPMMGTSVPMTVLRSCVQVTS